MVNKLSLQNHSQFTMGGVFKVHLLSANSK